MRELDDALKVLSDFESLVRNKLHPDRPLEIVKREHKWDSLNLACLGFRAGRLTVEAHAHASGGSRLLDVWVWDFSEPSGNTRKFDMCADVAHVARVVADYVNEYEAME